MQTLIILIWIVLITAFSVFGSWYAKKYERADCLIGLYVAFVLASNILAYKIAEYDFGLFVFYAPAASLIFSVTFLLTDIVNEKFGRRETQRMILIAFLAQVAFLFFTWIAINLNSAPFWGEQEMFSKLFGFAPRLAVAGWIAFLISENFDAYVFDLFKRRTHGKYLWMRNIFSSIPAMALDSVIFVTIAFYGVQPVVPVMLGSIVAKWVVGVIDVPFMYLNRAVMRN